MTQENNYQDKDLPILKILVIGQSGVGKSNIISRYAYDKFYIGNNVTIGIQFVSKNVTIDKKQFILQAWDTAGQQRFRSINKSFYRNALGAVIVFSLGDLSSFNKLPQWIEEVQQNLGKKPIFLLVGNKCDLKDQKVSVQEATQFAKQNKMAYLQTSAALNINIDQIFEMLSYKIYQLNKESLSLAVAPTNRISLLATLKNDQKSPKKQKQNCCS